ncbi:hypothetical protein Hanom_Chr12g01156091 [Helianthus anomalus]
MLSTYNHSNKQVWECFEQKGLTFCVWLCCLFCNVCRKMVKTKEIAGASSSSKGKGKQPEQQPRKRKYLGRDDDSESEGEEMRSWT